MHTDPHKGLHSEQGALRGEHQGRAADPVIKVVDLAWLEFGKPDLDRAETFARDFGFTTVERTPAALRLRGALPGTDCLVIRKSPASRFTGPVFQAADLRDLRRLADATGGEVADLEGGGRYVSTRTPSGIEVRVVHGAPEHGGLDLQRPLTLNCGARVDRVNAVQRPPREPARVERLGHVVLSTTVFLRDLDWFLEHLGLIVSDFLYLDGQRGRGPTMAFIRCDRGGEPADHHTLAMHLGPSTGYVHSAYQVADLDALATGGEYLKERGYRRSWGIGRHIQGSQIFDYWRDPDRLLLEHFTDGDRFDASVEPGWAAMSASGLAQWGPPATADFLGSTPSPALLREAIAALRADNELDLTRLLALAKAMRPS
ncbi:VOC family protein [Actinomadura madurae]|uniref:VOC family protein n=1 Tax=Actinomadura madurae TaxID=1993 RepID=UPI002025F032|nr:VOC family protein [Actinomadura madurae]MCP9950944.1 VOC family protein [Actinomadura madurae]MCP9967733.1 VOC family protein [Actinomadura madurae]MCP9980177.1 VOC family protein [Actinomadura madurae]MCQ0008295.1 VOC family protein [Actinomadura madurae]MCQ0016389.1 VOC family protein [Actinomadura madurae]